MTDVDEQFRPGLLAWPQFAEFGRMLGCRAASGVLMLWGFFDESGEHDRQTGELVRLTLGGCWASFEQWEGFVLNWAATLEAAGIRVFHMADFEANQGEFKGWQERPDDRRRLLDNLLDTIIEFVPECVGFSELVAGGSGGFKRAYERNIASMLANTSFLTQPAIVLARHDNYGPAQIAEVVEAAELAFTSIGFRVRTWSVDSPEEFCPLQAADLVAYEIARYGRETELGHPMRYPLRRLRERASSALAAVAYASWRQRSARSKTEAEEMSISSAGLGDDEPLVVSPLRAQRLLDVGHSHLYELIAAGELESYKDGKSRKITVHSIKSYIKRRLHVAAQGTNQ